ncbi:V-type ATP synthase subunit B [Pseudochelatococcus contaminans]|uniref:V/A-type H+-transporting ATPase subunit B n=1 Tax=Pseudochelatococcus contaminans TaxID=1538103 RepID=A0A7W5Z2J1_9HYPH|nr:V-type ATP synthase subunit B [Pseudochelatococcus contaminans]MBB3808614.1 V/A-type H+-transporting ATPase subunit B [Pseudochelatococcus contaminans]
MSTLSIHYDRVLSIVGEVVRIALPSRAPGVVEDDPDGPRYGDLAIVSEGEGDIGVTGRLAQVVRLGAGEVSLQVFGGTQGLSTRSRAQFLGHPPRVAFSGNILGRVFSGDGSVSDGGPALDYDPQVEIGGPSVNPVRRALASRMIRTNVPMIDVFNCLVESQKIPIFARAGEPYDPLLARIGVQADADIVVFGGLGLTFDDYWRFRSTFEDAGVFSRTVMFVNQAADPPLERLLVPDMALAVAEKFAIEEKKRVLVLLTDMTAFADALREVGVAMERVPSNRGYLGDLYSQLARRYEKATVFHGAGSVTILTVTTMPGGDVTHPVPDNTGYITEGQFYLRDGLIDPFGSLSRLKQHVIGKETREDHSAVMNTMIRLYAGAREADRKKAMAFDLSDYDERLVRFGEAFKERFMDIAVSIPLEEALDLGWATMAENFSPEELLIRQNLLDKYYPHPA